MQIKALALFLTAVLLLTLTSCFVTSRDTHVSISCEEFAENPTGIRNDFTVEPGDKIYVELCSNPSTGFEWSYQMSVQGVVNEEDHDYEESENDQPGAAGKDLWTFEGASPGTTVISMAYSQPWEGGTKGEWTYDINVTVEQ